MNNLPIVAAIPGDEPHEYHSAQEAITAMQAELIGQGKDPHGEVIVGVPLGGGKIALLRMPMEEAKKLDRLIGGGPYE